MPATVARPESGISNVVNTRTAVVFPAPFGPSKPRIVPSGTGRSRPSSAFVAPKDLRSASARTAASIPKRYRWRPTPVAAFSLLVANRPRAASGR